VLDSLQTGEFCSSKRLSTGFIKASCEKNASRKCTKNVLSLGMISYFPDSLKKTILKDKYVPIIFEKGKGREIYLVGGYVRDALMGLTSADRDFIVSGDLQSFVRKIQKITGGTVVQFKRDNMIRIALRDGFTFDFSKPMGPLKKDLSQRDFTLNAIAWSPDCGIIDYYQGVEDIKKKRIRALSENNMNSDPLRMIRAYRFAAELNGFIEYRTRKIIKTLCNKMKEVSPERITSELFNLLNSKNASKYLNMALDDGILTEILFISDRKLEINIRGVSKLERAIFGTQYYTLKVVLDRLFSQNLTHKGLLCLELLLCNENLSSGIENLTVCNRIIKHIELVHRGLSFIGNRRKLPLNVLFDIFMKARRTSKDVLIIKNRHDLFGEYERFKRIWKNGFLDSDEIIRFAELRTGPIIGEVIEKAKKAQFERIINTRKEAIVFIGKFRPAT
jgi:tRNA nucleotidyltransferase/poly(A) polymerase